MDETAGGVHTDQKNANAHTVQVSRHKYTMWSYDAGTGAVDCGRIEMGSSSRHQYIKLEREQAENQETLEESISSQTLSNPMLRLHTRSAGEGCVVLPLSG